MLISPETRALVMACASWPRARASTIPNDATIAKAEQPEDALKKKLFVFRRARGMLV